MILVLERLKKYVCLDYILKVELEGHRQTRKAKPSNLRWQFIVFRRYFKEKQQKDMVVHIKTGCKKGKGGAKGPIKRPNWYSVSALPAVGPIPH